jgi:hypothetical protein
MSKALDLSFTDLTPAEKTLKAPADVVKKIAQEVGAAEGFTARPGEGYARPRRPPQVQMNLKVPDEFREKFVRAFEEEASRNRAIRSLGDYLMFVFDAAQTSR